MSEHTADIDAPTPQGLVLFEVYEASGALLLVTSALDRSELEPTDRVYRRPWATAAETTRVIPPAAGDVS